METADYELLPGIWFYYNLTEEVTDNPAHYPHAHSFCELYFYVRGECCFIVESGVYAPVEGTVIFTCPGELHGVRIEKDCTYERYYLYIDPDVMKTIGFYKSMRCFFERPHGLQNTVILPQDINVECIRLLRKIMTLMKADEKDARSLAFAAFLEILHLVNHHADILPEHRNKYVRSKAVSRALRYLNENLDKVYTTTELSDAIHFSRGYLSRQFTVHLGITLNRYILLKRIYTSRRMLEQGYSLTEVCKACGWPDYSYFIAKFHEEVGTTPMKYQKEYRQKEEPKG